MILERALAAARARVARSDRDLGPALAHYESALPAVQAAWHLRPTSVFPDGVGMPTLARATVPLLQEAWQVLLAHGKPGTRKAAGLLGILEDRAPRHGETHLAALDLAPPARRIPGRHRDRGGRLPRRPARPERPAPRGGVEVLRSTSSLLADLAGVDDEQPTFLPEWVP